MTPLDIAPMSDTARALLRMAMHGDVHASVAELAERVGVGERHIKRAVAELVALGLCARDGRGGRGRVAALRANGDTERTLRALCHRLWREDEAPPGAEYTPLRDVEAARRDRAIYCHAVGRGPRWARDLGAAIARGEA